jgi:3-hydroxyisobutyrate dehydrogenase
MTPASAPRPTVAFLGLGAIGTPMAEHVATATDLIVWNRTKSKADDFAAVHAALGVRVAWTPAEAVKDADVVITCLPSSVEVEQIAIQTDGILQALRPNAVFVDCTSGHPTVSQRIAHQVREKGADFLDAPVSGGVSGAQAGTLTVMCGGNASALERVRPVLATFGQKIVLCGGVGCGDALKAVNNALLALHIWSTAEGLVMLKKMGVDPAIALDVINASSGRSNTSMNLFPERVLTRAFPNTFRLALLDKDARIAADIATRTESPAALITLASQLFSQAHDYLGDDVDHVAAVQVIEKMAGEVIVPGITAAP